jgi:hypothetical protein
LAQVLQRDAVNLDTADAMQSLQSETRRVSERLKDLAQMATNNPVSQQELNQGRVELF